MPPSGRRSPKNSAGSQTAAAKRKLKMPKQAASDKKKY